MTQVDRRSMLKGAGALSASTAIAVVPSSASASAIEINPDLIEECNKCKLASRQLKEAEVYKAARQKEALDRLEQIVVSEGFIEKKLAELGSRPGLISDDDWMTAVIALLIAHDDCGLRDQINAECGTRAAKESADQALETFKTALWRLRIAPVSTMADVAMKVDFMVALSAEWPNRTFFDNRRFLNRLHCDFEMVGAFEGLPAEV